ncbi:PEP-CTERM sorting domain-containing protein [Sulfuricella denitrificans]|nr:PEP-CTERM sorting domain-containing protein [Sulfuricella denitrificans]
MKALNKYDISEQKPVQRLSKVALFLVAALGFCSPAGAGAIASSSTTLSNFSLGFSNPNSIAFSGFSSGSASITAPPGPYGGATATVQASGNGAGFGTNTWVGTFFVTAPTSVEFGFTADSNMLTDLTPGGLAAAANLNMTISINDLFTNTSVFSWAPNGMAGGIVGGIETMDAFDLNHGISQFGTLGTTTFQPGSGQFSAYSALLGQGFYLMNISMSNSAFVSSGGLPISAVPEPTALWLLGIGSLAFFISRRKYLQ